MKLLEARGLSKSFGGAQILRDVSFGVDAGDFIVLRGHNGSGKSTLLNILSGLVAPDLGSILLSHGGQQLKRFDFGADRRHDRGFSISSFARSGVLRSWQDVRLFSSLSLVDNLDIAVHSQLGERLGPALLQRGAVHREQKRLTEASRDLLASFGLSHLILGEVEQGSGRDQSARSATGVGVSLGEAKRVAIARACRGISQVLLLDEPLGGLDARGANAVVKLLRVLNQERDLAMLVIEHESIVEHLAPLATAVWRLESGCLIDEGRSPARSGEADFHARWSHGVSRSGETATVTILPGSARLTVIAPTCARQVPGLEVRDLEVTRNGRPVLPPVSFLIPEGGLGILEAPNGWGKSTLAEAIAGLLPVAAGQIATRECISSQSRAWQRRARGISLLPSRSCSFPGLKVHEALLVSGVRQTPSFLSGLEGRSVASLSGGERQRLIFACSVGGGDAVTTIWDEPFLGLDEAGVEHLTEAVRARRPDQTFLVLIPANVHDLDNAEQEAS